MALIWNVQPHSPTPIYPEGTWREKLARIIFGTDTVAGKTFDVALLVAMREDLRTIPYVASVVSVLDVPLLRQKPGPGLSPLGVPNLTSDGVDLDAARTELRGHTHALG